MHCASRAKEQSLGRSSLIQMFCSFGKTAASLGLFQAIPSYLKILISERAVQAPSAVISKAACEKQEKVGLIQGHLESSCPAKEGG